MRVEQEVKLDFDDVLIRPKRSRMPSRAKVDIFRTYRTLNSKREWSGTPIIAANMDAIGTIEMAKVFRKFDMFVCLHKFYSEKQLVEFFNSEDSCNSFYTIGMTTEDTEKLEKVSKQCKNNIKQICIDVANGYSEVFQDHVKNIRDKFPTAIIMAGNVATPEMTQELLISGGADIIKLGIGPGCFIAGTKVLTDNGKIPIEKVKVGDKVYTHTGKKQKVIKTISRIEKKRIIDVNGIKCTPNHKFYVILKTDKEKINDNNIDDYAKWVSAENLNDNYLLIKIAN